MAKKKEQSFEQSLEELHEIVGQLEEGQLGLEDSLEKFERGTQLLRQCHSKLEEAEAKIEQLTGFDADGNPVTAPFDATDTLSQKESTAGKRKSTAKKSKKKADDSESSSLF